MPRSKGFSSLEVVVASLLSALVFCGFFGVAGQIQVGCSDMNLLLERDSNLWLAPLLFSRWIAPAGNNRWGQPWPGVAAQPGLLELNSDIHGKEGFPDQELTSSFEALRLRVSKTNLQVKSGRGSFQPVIKNIAGLTFDSQQLPIVGIKLEAVTDRSPSFEGNLPEAVEFSILLRNYRPSLFSESP